MDGDDGDPGNGTIFVSDEMNTELDDVGYGLSRVCPEPPTFTLGGTTKTIDTEGLCNLGSIIAAIVLLLGWAHGIWAFVGGNR
jgi:hypothetical protein